MNVCKALGTAPVYISHIVRYMQALHSLLPLYVDILASLEFIILNGNYWSPLDWAMLEGRVLVLLSCISSTWCIEILKKHLLMFVEQADE